MLLLLSWVILIFKSWVISIIRIKNPLLLLTIIKYFLLHECIFRCVPLLLLRHLSFILELLLLTILQILLVIRISVLGTDHLRMNKTRGTLSIWNELGLTLLRIKAFWTVRKTSKLKIRMEVLIIWSIRIEILMQLRILKVTILRSSIILWCTIP